VRVRRSKGGQGLPGARAPEVGEIAGHHVLRRARVAVDELLRGPRHEPRADVLTPQVNRQRPAEQRLEGKPDEVDDSIGIASAAEGEATGEGPLLRRGRHVDDHVVGVQVLGDVAFPDTGLDRLDDVAVLGDDQRGMGPAREVAVAEANALARLDELAQGGGFAPASFVGGSAVKAEVAGHQHLGRRTGRVMRHLDSGLPSCPHGGLTLLFSLAARHDQPRFTESHYF
jgi:hypothetical protein